MLARFAYLITFSRLVAGMACRMSHWAAGSASAAHQPAKARRAHSAASITHRPITKAPAHLASRNSTRYCPTVICMVQRISAGTLWMLRLSGPRPKVRPQ